MQVYMFVLYRVVHLLCWDFLEKNSYVLRFVVCLNFDSAGPQSPKKVIKKSNKKVIMNI